MYLKCSVGLIKTKAYLILAYIVNEEENEILNATHDHLNYILGERKSANLQDVLNDLEGYMIP